MENYQLLLLILVLLLLFGRMLRTLAEAFRSAFRLLTLLLVCISLLCLLLWV